MMKHLAVLPLLALSLQAAPLARTVSVMSTVLPLVAVPPGHLETPFKTKSFNNSAPAGDQLILTLSKVILLALCVL